MITLPPMVWWKMAKKREIPVHSEENMGFFFGGVRVPYIPGGFSLPKTNS